MYGAKKGIPSSGYQRYLCEMRRQINSELSGIISGTSILRLSPQIRYALVSRGKRLRPILLTLSTRCVGGDQDVAMPLAIAFELIHTTTLIHDDIIDKDELRRGMPTLYRKWSLEDAILAGDAMIALAINLAAGFGAEIMRVVSQSALELCDGEYMDIHSSLRTTTEEDYFLRIKKKSASLFRDAAYCGALIGGGSCSEIESLSKYGENFGMAYQMRDDLLDLGDLKRIPITLPIIHYYEMSDSKRKKQLESDLQLLDGSQDGDGSPTRVDFKRARIQRMLNESGSVAYCMGKVAERIQESIVSIASLKDTNFKSYLIQIVESLAIV